MTWGNRPEEKPSTDLGIAPVKGDGVDVAVPSTDQDINAAYDDAVHVLANKPPPEVKTVNPEEKMNDSYRAIRTNASLYFIADIGSPSRASLTCWTGCAGQVLLAWTLTNGGLVAGILSTSAGSSVTSTQSNVYMAFLLYSVAGGSEFSVRRRAGKGPDA